MLAAIENLATLLTQAVAGVSVANTYRERRVFDMTATGQHLAETLVKMLDNAHDVHDPNLVIAKLFALIAVLGTAVVYGTDVFCAMVQRPALARVDDRTLLAVMGNIHRYGDRRMPVPGVLGVVAAAISAAFAAASGCWTQAGAAGVAVGLLLVWLVLYLRVSAPINHQLTAAADHPAPPTDARQLQRNWDKVITIRAMLQGLAVAALCLTLLI
jgi:Domain of unknown function (DUF1772)